MTVVLLAFVVALAAAVRSTWSPCGVSMLSTITPLAEASRGRRYRFTATCFVLGATAGGVALGAVAAAAAFIVRAAGLGRSSLLVLATLGALVAAALDGGVAGPRLPHHRRQVNELWLDRYRGWVYGVGFGGQIGFGLATFIMTAAVYLTVVLAALTARPLVALAVGTTFGLTRGLVVLAGARLTTPDALGRFHARFEAWRRPVARLAVVVECLVAVMAAATLGAVAAVVTVLLIGIGVLTVVARPGRPASPARPARPARRVDLRSPSSDRSLLS